MLFFWVEMSEDEWFSLLLLSAVAFTILGLKWSQSACPPAKAQPPPTLRLAGGHSEHPHAQDACAGGPWEPSPVPKTVGVESSNSRHA